MDDTNRERLGATAPQDAGAENAPAFRKVERHFWRRMTRGLLVIIPLLVTFLILRYLVAILENLIRPAAELILDIPRMDQIPWATPPRLDHSHLRHTRVPLPARLAGNRREGPPNGERRAELGSQPHPRRGQDIHSRQPGHPGHLHAHELAIQPRCLPRLAARGRSRHGPGDRPILRAVRRPRYAGYLHSHRA